LKSKKLHRIVIFKPLGDSQGGGVAYEAHIGGFVAGLLLVNFLRLGEGK
jgi:membrane associated rhomboid family serine protease